MPDLIAIVDDRATARSQLAAAISRFKIAILDASGLRAAGALPAGNLYFDVDLTDPDTIAALKDKLGGKRREGHTVFGVPKGVHSAMVQAYALGATDVLPVPMDNVKFAQRLAEAIGVLPEEEEPSTQMSAAGADAMHVSASALKTIFAFAHGLEDPDLGVMQHAAKAAADVIMDEGLGRWVASVQKHHQTTFQHCLLVSGVAAAFGHHLGMRRIDIERLTMAGLLHDIGKAKIPLAILDKQGRLSDDEMAVMRTHPVIGYEILINRKDIGAELLSAVRHHHEYLDGSGYPDGLLADNITDLVRIMTIADIYGALIERRSYKKPLSSDIAYQILASMKGKLEEPLLRAFQPMALNAKAA